MDAQKGGVGAGLGADDALGLALGAVLLDLVVAKQGWRGEEL